MSALEILTTIAPLAPLGLCLIAIGVATVAFTLTLAGKDPS